VQALVLVQALPQVRVPELQVQLQELPVHLQEQLALLDHLLPVVADLAIMVLFWNRPTNLQQQLPQLVQSSRRSSWYPLIFPSPPWQNHEFNKL
jgi:hypothetical protein